MQTLILVKAGKRKLHHQIDGKAAKAGVKQECVLKNKRLRKRKSQSGGEGHNFNFVCGWKSD